MRSADPRLLARIEDGLAELGPAATLRRTELPPIVGAALLALERSARRRRAFACTGRADRGGCEPRARGGALMAGVRYRRSATRIYPGTDAPAVDALDLEIADGEFLVLVGPSGSGKTTALRMLAGLEEVDAGAISIGDRT